MYDLPDFLRYGGLSALGLALAATGLPANAAVSQPQNSTVLSYLDTAGVAAAAQPDRRAERERGEGRASRGTRENRAEARQQRREARQNQQRAARQDDRRQARQNERRQARQNTGNQARGTSPEWDARLRARAAYREQQAREQRRDSRQDRREARRDYRQADRRYDRREARRDARRDYRQAERRADRRYDRREARRDQRRWDRRWRNNNRYDWHRYRAQNRRLYSLGRYYAPYRDYSYRRLSVGFTLGSLFFGNRYRINNPWQYRLPEVYGPYRWVRYYDDVLLVNTYSGEVVDVIYNFFW